MAAVQATSHFDQLNCVNHLLDRELLKSVAKESNVPQYRGNLGNLLQHWVLCEILSHAYRSGVEHMAFVDAYSMAPIARERREAKENLFDSVCRRLPGERTAYENAWHKLVQKFGDGYPNSANLLTALWPGRYSLLLCEMDQTTSRELKAWITRLKKRSRKCAYADVFPGDWREGIADGLGLPGDFSLFSFDPNMINCRDVDRQKARAHLPKRSHAPRRSGETNIPWHCCAAINLCR